MLDIGQYQAKPDRPGRAGIGRDRSARAAIPRLAGHRVLDCDLDRWLVEAPELSKLRDLPILDGCGY